MGGTGSTYGGFTCETVRNCQTKDGPYVVLIFRYRVQPKQKTTDTVTDTAMSTVTPKEGPLAALAAGRNVVVAMGVELVFWILSGGLPVQNKICIY